MSDRNVTEILNFGVAAQEAGKLQEAVKCYTNVLSTQPENALALHNLGLIGLQIGRVKSSIELFEAAITEIPLNEKFWVSYIEALIQLGEIEVARQLIEIAPFQNLSHEKFEKFNLILLDKSMSASDELPENVTSHLINLYEQNNLDQLLSSCEALIPEYKNSHVLWNIIGATKKRQEALNDAIIAFNNAIKLNNKYPDALNNLGVCLLDKGDPAGAISALEKAILFKPDYVEAQQNLAKAFKANGSNELAIAAYLAVLKLQPRNARAYFNLGNIYTEEKLLEQANGAYRNAIIIDPEYVDAYNNLGKCLFSQNLYDEAIVEFDKCIRLTPDNAEIAYSIARTYHEKQSFEVALSYYEQAISLDKNHYEYHIGKAMSLTAIRRREEAVDTYNTALLLEPQNASIYHNLGITLNELGRYHEAIKVFNSAIKINPEFLEAKINMHYCNGRSLEKNGDFRAAFENYEIAGQLKKTTIGYNHSRSAGLFAAAKATSDQIRKFALSSKGSSDKPTPIFIVGMPRSGTTLLEQILSSHSQVQGAGELEYMDKYGRSLTVGDQKASKTTLIDVRKSYMEKVSSLSRGTAYMTDKMPQNFLYIGLITSIIPEAKIIHMQRQAEAVCWSNFTRNFDRNSLGYSYEIHDIVGYYNLYSELMRFWHELYPKQIYNVDYEKLVADQSTQIESLLEYLHLEPEELCFTPELNKRVVQTASKDQVTLPIYQGSSNAWKNFEPFVNTAFALLDL